MLTAAYIDRKDLSSSLFQSIASEESDISIALWRHLPGTVRTEFERVFGNEAINLFHIESVAEKREFVELMLTCLHGIAFLLLHAPQIDRTLLLKNFAKVIDPLQKKSSSLDVLCSEIFHMIGDHVRNLLAPYSVESGNNASEFHGKATCKRMDAIKAITGLLVSTEGRFDTIALMTLKTVIQENKSLQCVLGYATTEHILTRLKQFIDTPDLCENLNATIDSCTRVPIHAQAKELLSYMRENPTQPVCSRDIGLALVGALLYKLRQPGPCWTAAMTIDIQENQPGYLLGDLEKMLTTGTVEQIFENGDIGKIEMCEVPIAITKVGRVKITLSNLNISDLMRNFPSLADLRYIADPHLNVGTLEDLFMDAVDNLCKKRHSGESTIGELIEAMLLVHSGLSETEYDRAMYLQSLGKQDVKFMSEKDVQNRQKLQQFGQAFKSALNILAAREHNLLLMSWAMGVPAIVQRRFALDCWDAIDSTMEKFIGRLGTDISYEDRCQFQEVIGVQFIQNVHFLWNDPQINLENRLATMLIRTRQIDGRGTPVDNAARFQELFRIFLEECVFDYSDPDEVRVADRYRRNAIKACNDSQFADQVMKSFRSTHFPYGYNGMPTQTPWSRLEHVHALAFDWKSGAVHDSSKKRLLLQKPGQIASNNKAIKVFLNGQWYIQDKPNAGSSAAEKSLANAIFLMRTLHTQKKHELDATLLNMGNKLHVAGGIHQFRLLPFHPSWQGAWVPGNGQDLMPIAHWIQSTLLEPAHAASNKPHPERAMRSLLQEVMGQLTLPDNIHAVTLIQQSLEKCPSIETGREKNYMLKDVIRSLCEQLKTQIGKADDILAQLTDVLQNHPLCCGHMVIYADSNWVSKDDGSPPCEPILLGFAYDMVDRTIKHWRIVETAPLPGTSEPVRCCRANRNIYL
jgi:hypothetical protein